MAKTTVLVVDDEESMRYFLTRALKRKGFAVAAAATGEEALSMIDEEPRDVVLLDLMLPGRDGIEITEDVKARCPETTVILMTGYGTVERALEAMRRGASDFVTKPFTGEEIVAKIQEAQAKARPSRPVTPAPPPPPTRPGPEEPDRSASPPQPLAAFLVESARAYGIPLESDAAGDLPFRDAGRLFETLYFTELLGRTSGNVSLAARISGISRPSLHRKIHDLHLDMTHFRT